MGNLSSALQQLRAERKRAQSQVGEVRSSNLSDRVTKRFGNTRKIKPTDACNIGGFTPQDGAGAKSSMGKSSYDITASSGESDSLGSCEAHHVPSSPEEDRRVPAGTVGEVEGRKKSCLEGVFAPHKPVQAGVQSKSYEYLVCPAI